MSPTKRSTIVHRLFTSVLQPIPQVVRFLLAAAVVLAIVWPASAVSVSWDAGGSSTSLYWSNGANWSPDGVPGTADDVTFSTAGASGTVGAITNEVTASATVNSILYEQEQPLYHTTQIDAGQTLKISGSIDLSQVPTKYPNDGSNTPWRGNVSLFVGSCDAAGTTINSQTNITGSGGTLDISSATGGNTGGDIFVAQMCTTAGAHNAILDLSGLGTFNANIDQLLVGLSQAGNVAPNSSQRAVGTLYLAQNNNLTLNATGTVNSAALVIGYSSGNSAISGTLYGSYVYLGQTNILNADNVIIGGRKGGGTLAYNPMFANASLTMRGHDGSSRVALIAIGDNTNNGTSSTGSFGTMDLTGVDAHIQATSIILGRTPSSGATSGTVYNATGTLTFSKGTIDVTGMTVGLQGSNSICVAQGTVNVAGTGNLLFGSSGLILGQFAGGTGTSTGTLNINGGTVSTLPGSLGADITDGGGTSAITMTSGTIDMQGHNIGSLSAPIDTFTLRGGNVANVGNLSVNNFKAFGNVSLPSGTLTIGSGGTIDMRDGAANTLSAANLTLSGSSTLYYELSNNTSSGNDIINLTGALTFGSGNTTVFISRLGSNFASGTYTLITYGSKSGSGIYNFTNTTRSGMNITDTGSGPGSLNLTVTNNPGHDLTWNGGTYGTWDVINSGNKVWTSLQAPTPDMYYDTDNVTFGTQAAATTILLQNSINTNGFIPGSVTVNSNTDYTFNAYVPGSDRISGNTGLTKNGTGTLTINFANDYMGVTNLNAGKIVLGNATALGSASSALVMANLTTLDLNTYQLGSKPITVQGAGVDGNGAIVNNSPTAPGATQYDVSNVTLSGDTTIGGTSTISPYNPGMPGGQYVGRWSMRANGGTATLSTGGHAYNLTKTGNNQIMLVNTSVDSALADVFVNEGVLGLEGATNLGDPTKTVTVDGAGAGQPSGGSMLQFNKVTIPLNKNVLLKNNGALYALGNSADTDNTISGAVVIDDSGGVFNAGGLRADYAANANWKLTISGPISGSSLAGLTKAGPGSVTLTNPANSFNGLTTLSEGALILNGGSLGGGVTMSSGTALTVNGSVGGSVTMASNATLNGTGTVGGTVTDASGTVIAPGATIANNSVGTLSLNNLTLSGGGTLNMDLSNNTSSGNDLFSLGGNLSLNGVTTIAINQINGFGSLVNGTYHLINYAGSKTGAGTLTATGLPTGSRRSFDLNDATAHQINLVVTGSSLSLWWKGDGGSNYWNSATPSNNIWYTSPGGPTLDVFYNLDTVTFDDNSTNQTVNISSDVMPGSINVNANKNYTFEGNNKITGITGITKSGTGSLILANYPGNDFTGNIIINAGTLVFNYGTDNKATNVISGSGSVEQRGVNTILTLSGANTYDGATLISAGSTLVAGSNSALGSTVGGTMVANGARLDVNGMSLGAEAVTVQGDGVDTYGAIVNNSTVANQNALRFVTLTGNTTFGGNARWDIRTDTPATVPASLTGNGYNLTKTGTSLVYLANLGNVDLGNVNVNYGDLGVQGTTTFADGSTGDLAKPITVASGAMLTLWSLPATNVINKKLTLQGGTLQATTGAGTNNTYGGEITLDPAYGGGTISTAPSTAITVTGNIVGPGASLTLTKSGTAAGSGGTVTLSGANTFSGTTNLNGGTLIVTGSLAGGITMSMGTTLAGTGTISGATQDYLNTIIAPGATAANGAIGTLTFGSDLALGGGGSGQINMDLTSNPSGTNDMINVGGNLSLYGGTVQVNPVNGVLGTGTYHLIHYTGTPLSGYASYLLLSGIPDNTRQSYGLSSATSHYIDLVVSGTPPASLVWAGGLNGNAWDVKTTTNWSGSDSLFWNADQVTFGNTGSNSPAVNIVGTVLPGSVVVDSTQNYTFSGSGKISGGTSLTKRGAGTLTLATSNDYTGQTKVEAGTLLITGSIGNNSPVLISGGTLMAGSNSALGTNNTVGTTINGSGTLDINAMNLQTEPITVQGAGVGGNGAIVNNSTSGVLFGYQSNALTQITLTGDTTFGGTGDGVNANSARWDIRGTGASLSTGGHAYNLTKTGNNVVSLVSVTVDSALADININQGTLRFENSSGFGDLSKTVTIASGATLQLLKTSNAMGKKVVSNGGTISASSDNPDPSNLDLVTGTVTVNSTTTVNAGTSTGILTLTNLISGAGGLTKTGPGTVIITGLPAYNGDTAVNVGILEINTVGSPVLHNVTGTATLSVGDGISATNLTVDSMNIGTLTLGIGSRVTIAPLPGGPTAGTNSLTSVPEPSTWAMLMLAAMGLGIYWRRSR